ncbi:hypothetical protein PFICI_02232 [Pestalotiopsis fici W106-1]|uniref:Uncharacterized protein n=1 Tax=Pestalotiopsis fici (strain W106-1 / CGMCC3.15140) TaxID=1229662 RepID=W3XFL0_PESFW|nr:uncharacterized protein PFICI_02232 [Pestalotiopsis fici W106-1]ETS84207.1 hypothetical protein PFICI_02232 [Pestalotiopsis fici W106-1]
MATNQPNSITAASPNDPPRPMTSRNLNKTWRDVVWEQYAQDLAADVPFPVRYLIHAAQWRRDIFITIPSKIDARTLRRAVLEFAKERRREADPFWDGEYISVRLRARPALTGQGESAAESVPLDDGPERGYTTDETEEYAARRDCRRP